jgi:hypothetical protein
MNKTRNTMIRMSMVTGWVAAALILPSAAWGDDWNVHVIDGEGLGADGVRLADVNGDGLLDIASGWEQQKEVRVYIHPGAKKATQPWPKVVVGTSEHGGPEDAFFSDLDGDGAFDVVSSWQGSKKIYIHWAPADPDDYLDEDAWTTEILPGSDNYMTWLIAAPMQIDGKNGPDLVAGGTQGYRSEQVVWFESPDNPRDLSAWKSHVMTNQSGWLMGLLPEDMDGDGDPDALLGVRKNNKGVKWLENPGPGEQQTQQWTVHELSDGTEGAGFVTTADLDQDGLEDVLAPVMAPSTEGEGILQIFRRLAEDGSDWQTIEIGLPDSREGKYKGVAVGDIDLDGRDDVVVTYEYGPMYLLQHDGDIGPGHWTHQRIGDGGKFDDVMLYDIDQDGDLDALTTDENDQQVIWFENPARQVPEPATLGLLGLGAAVMLAGRRR